MMETTPQGIPYEWGSSGSGGAWYELYPLSGIHTLLDIKKAKRWCYQNFDVEGHISSHWLPVSPQLEDDVPHWNAYEYGKICYIWLDPGQFPDKQSYRKMKEVLRRRYPDVSVRFGMNKPGEAEPEHFINPNL